MKTGVQRRMSTKRLSVILTLLLVLLTTAYLIPSTTAETNQSGKQIERIEGTEYGRVIHYTNATRKVEFITRENVTTKEWHSLTYTMTLYTTNSQLDIIKKIIQFNS